MEPFDLASTTSVQVRQTQAGRGVRRRAGEGEVKRLGGDTTGVSYQNTASAADIGLSRKDIHEARQLRDAEEADPGVTRWTLDEQVERGEELTKAALRREIIKRPVIDHGDRDPTDFNRAMLDGARKIIIPDAKVGNIPPENNSSGGSETR